MVAETQTRTETATAWVREVRTAVKGMMAAGLGPDAQCHIAEGGVAYWQVGRSCWRVGACRFRPVGMGGAAVTRRELERAVKGARRYGDASFEVHEDAEYNEIRPFLGVNLEGTVQVPAAIAGAVRTVVHACLPEEDAITEKSLLTSGVCVRRRPGGGVYVDATDCCQLARVELEGVEFPEVVIPRPAADEFAKGWSVDVDLWNGGWWALPVAREEGRLVFRPAGAAGYPCFGKVFDGVPSGGPLYRGNACQVGELCEWAAGACGTPMGTFDGGAWVDLDDRDLSARGLVVQVASPFECEGEGVAASPFRVDLRRLGRIAEALPGAELILETHSAWKPASVRVKGQENMTFLLMPMQPRRG